MPQKPCRELNCLLKSFYDDVLELKRASFLREGKNIPGSRKIKTKEKEAKLLRFRNAKLLALVYTTVNVGDSPQVNPSLLHENKKFANVHRSTNTMCTLEKRGNVFLLTLTGDDEHRLHPTLIADIRSALSQVRSQAMPGSALITTAQGKFFSNGFDLAWAAQSTESSFEQLVQLLIDSFKPVVADLLSLPLPTIAAVTGHAAAAGFILALSHDYILMRKDRGVLYMSEIDIEIFFPNYFMVMLRSKIVSPLARRNVVLQGKKLKAEEAANMKIIDSAYDSAEDTVKAALCLAVELGARKWNGEIYSDIRKNCFAEVSKAVGLDVETAVVAKL